MYAHQTGADRPAVQRPSEQLILPRLIKWQSIDRPNSLFLQEVDGSALTYGEAFNRVEIWAASLRSRGVVPGDRIVGMLPNTIDGVLVWLASSLIGAIYVPINTAYLGPVLAHAVQSVQPVGIVVDQAYAARLANVSSELTGDPFVLIREFDHDGGQPPSGLSADSLSTLDRPPGAADNPEAFQAAWSDHACLLFTSGTTGPSKPIAVRWLQLFESSRWIWQSGYASSEDRIYSPWPLNHVSGAAAIYAMASVGGCVVLRQGWSTSQFLPDVYAYNCTMTTLMAEMVRYVDELELPAELGPCPLERVFVAPVRAETALTMKRLGARYCTVYNSTELSAPITSLGFEPVPVGSCGVVRPGYSIAIVDGNGMEVPAGETGELWVRPDDPVSASDGYWGLPAQTEQAWVNGWFHTGDAVRQDAAGYVYFLDRLKHRIRVRGENVSAFELEQVVNKFDGVRQSAAVGVRVDDGDDRIVLFVQLSAAGTSAESLMELCQLSLPKFMVPSEIIVVEKFPETATGKLQKEKLLAHLE